MGARVARITAAALAAALALLALPLAASPAAALDSLTPDRDHDGLIDTVDPDDDNDGLTDLQECSGEHLAPLIQAGTPDLKLVPSLFGQTIGPKTDLDLTADISDQFGYGAGSGAVVVTIENAHTHPTADIFISGHNSVTNGPAGETRVQITGTLGLYVDLRHDVQWFNNDTKILRTHDGTQLINTIAAFGGSDPAGWSRPAPVTLADGFEYRVVGPPVVPPAEPGKFAYEFPTLYTSPIYMTATPAPAILNILTDFGFETTLAHPGLYPVMDVFLYAECDSDGDGIGDRLDREISGADDAGSGPMDVPVTINVLDNDSTQMSIGDLAVTGFTQPVAGGVVTQAGNVLTYTPPTGFSGFVEFTYTAVDPIGQSIIQTVRIAITPIGADDAATTPAGTAVPFNALGNDPTKSLTLGPAPTSVPANGTVVTTADGTVSYTPNAGFVGVDTFTITAMDADGQLVVQTMSITVTPRPAAVVTAASGPTTIASTGLDPTAGIVIAGLLALVGAAMLIVRTRRISAD